MLNPFVSPVHQIRNDLLFTPSQHALETYLISPTTSTTSSPPSFDNGGKALTLQGGDKTLSEAKEAIRIKRLWKEIRDLDGELQEQGGRSSSELWPNAELRRFLRSVSSVQITSRIPRWTGSRTSHWYPSSSHHLPNIVVRFIDAWS